MKYLLILFVLLIALTQCVRNSNSCPTLVHTCRENVTNTVDTNSNTNKFKRAARTRTTDLPSINEQTDEILELDDDWWTWVMRMPV